MAPPPPGPITRKSPGRSAAALDRQSARRIAGRERSFIDTCLMLADARCCAPRSRAAMHNERSGKRPPGHWYGGRTLADQLLERDPQSDSNVRPALEATLLDYLTLLPAPLVAGVRPQLRTRIRRNHVKSQR